MYPACARTRVGPQAQNCKQTAVYSHAANSLIARHPYVTFACINLHSACNQAFGSVPAFVDVVIIPYRFFDTHGHFIPPMYWPLYVSNSSQRCRTPPYQFSPMAFRTRAISCQCDDLLHQALASLFRVWLWTRVWREGKGEGEPETIILEVWSRNLIFAKQQQAPPLTLCSRVYLFYLVCSLQLCHHSTSHSWSGFSVPDAYTLDLLQNCAHNAVILELAHARNEELALIYTWMAPHPPWCLRSTPFTPDSWFTYSKDCRASAFISRSMTQPSLILQLPPPRGLVISVVPSLPRPLVDRV